MVRDDLRNAAFEAALLRAVKPESQVLDIGSGTGLLAMIAARAGARRVVTCEANPAIAEVATQIVAQNGFADQINVIASHSTDLDPQTALGGKADIIVSEIIGKDFVCEGVLPAMLDAARRLLAPGGKMIPAAGSIRVALAQWDGIELFKMDRVLGFDVTPFNQLRHDRFSLEVGNPQLSLRSDHVDLFNFDFAATNPAPGNATAQLVARDGPVNGLVQWLHLQMDDEAEFDNRPSPGTASSWACLFFPFAEEHPAGSSISIAGACAQGRLRIWEVPGPLGDNR